MQVVAYSANFADQWDAFVRTSRNGTFLFERGFMDYHADRFEDASILFFHKDKIAGVFPASITEKTVTSHAGLTYGGIVTGPDAHATTVGEMLDEAIRYYRNRGVEKIVVKPTPYIYYSHPSDDLLYWLFRHGATMKSRGLSSAVDLTAPCSFSTLRRRHLAKARRAGLVCTENIAVDDACWELFWTILTDVLRERHGRTPVHTLSEMRMLKTRFPQQIQLWTAANAEGRVIAGTVLFVTDRVVHAQYIASSPEGKNSGALELLFDTIITHFSDEVTKGSSHRFLDFGISTEDGGNYLNEGLAFQKEGLGGRSVVYDCYSISL